MSINVTVSGNPISIKRGRIVTTDSISSKEEFDKRRLMRLEQVRQQSKDIAGEVRNKVRNEKMKQLKKIEEEGREQLRDWKNRKLLELQSQYKEALKEFGSGHREAKNVEMELQSLKEEEMQNKSVSLTRGRAATAKLQIDKNKENVRKSHLQTRKNARAISGVKRQHKTQSQITNINITISDSSCDSDELNIQDVEHVVMDENQKSFKESNESLESPRKPLVETENFGKCILDLLVPNLDNYVVILLVQLLLKLEILHKFMLRKI